MDIKLSVIIPVFGAGQNLVQCLKSACIQTLKNIEIICINNGLNESVFEILSSFEKKDSRIRLVSKIDEGYGCAVNIGLNLAGGEYVSFLEQNDFIDKKMFEKLYALATKCDADIVKSSYFKFFDKTKKEPEKKEKVSFEKYCKIPTWFFRIEECPSFFSFHPSIWSSIYKRTFLNSNSIRFVEARGFAGVDNSFQVESMILAQKIIYTGAAYYYRRQNLSDDSCCNVNPSVFFDRADEMHEILSRYKNKDKNILANIYKRELWFVQKALETTDTRAANSPRGIGKSGVKLPLDDFDIKNVPYETRRRIEKTISGMDEDIIRNNPAINTFEKNFYNILSGEKAKGTI